MSRLSNMQGGFLSYEKFRFTIEVTTLMVPPPYKGAISHGAFGNAFRLVVCAAPRADCSTCLLRRQCLYVALFDPLPLPGYPEAGKFNEAPRPYGLNPPLTNSQAFHAGEVLDFELARIGRVIDALPYFVFTLSQMGGAFSELKSESRRRTRTGRARGDSSAREGGTRCSWGDLAVRWGSAGVIVVGFGSVCPKTGKEFLRPAMSRNSSR